MLSTYNVFHFNKIALSLPGYSEISDKLVQEIGKSPYHIVLDEKDITRWEFLWPNTRPILTDYAFTSIICSFALHHLNGKWKKIILEKLRGSLKSDGQLIIVDTKPDMAWCDRSQAISFYWRMAHEKDNGYPAWLIAKNILSCLLFRRPLSAAAWEELLTSAGYRDIKNKTFGDFVLIEANN